MKYDSIAEAYIKSKHPMIKIGGKEYHRHNSNGEPLHHTDEGIKKFHKWFEGSIHVDEHGRPIPMYHDSVSMDTHDISDYGIMQDTGERHKIETFSFDDHQGHQKPVYFKQLTFDKK